MKAAEKDRRERKRERARRRRERLIEQHRARLARHGFEISVDEVRQRATLILRSAGIDFDEIDARVWIDAEYAKDAQGLSLYHIKPLRETPRCTVRVTRWKPYTIPGLGTGRMTSEVAVAHGASFPAALLELRRLIKSKHGEKR